jgi:hypothetical protein
MAFLSGSTIAKYSISRCKFFALKTILSKPNKSLERRLCAATTAELLLSDSALLIISFRRDWFMILVMIRENTMVVKMRKTDIKTESFNLILSKIAGIKGV